MIERRRADRVVAAALAIGLCAVALVAYQPFTFLHGDGAFYANIVKSLARDGSLDQGQYHPRSWLEADLGWNDEVDQGFSNVSLGRDGRWLPKHSWVMPLFTVPFYAVFGMAGLLIFHVTMLAVALFAAYRTALSLMPAGPAALATLLVGAQPLITGDVYSYNNDVFYTALLALGTWAFTARRAGLSGLLLGIACWAKITNVLYVVPLGIWLLARRDARAAARGIAAFALPLVIFLASNAWLFGSPTTTSYDVILVRQGGVLTTEGIGQKFSSALAPGLERVLEDSGQGLNRRAPILWASVVGTLALATLPGAAPWVATWLWVLLAFLGLHAKYDYTYARFFLPVATLSVVPLGALLQKFGRFRWEREAVLLLGVLAGVAMLSRALPDGARWSAVEEVENAAVRHGKTPCDYFNNMHQKFECPGDSRRGRSAFWGRAMGEDQCVFDEEPRDMLWLHPPQGARRRTIRFDGVPSGTLSVEYGLAATSRHDDVRFEVRLNDQKLPLAPVVKRGERLRYEASPEAMTESNTLEIVVQGKPREWRHLCIGARVE